MSTFWLPRCLLGADTHGSSLPAFVKVCVEYQPTGVSASFCVSVAPYHAQIHVKCGVREWARGGERWTEDGGQSPAPAIRDGEGKVCLDGPAPGEPRRPSERCHPLCARVSTRTHSGVTLVRPCLRIWPIILPSSPHCSHLAVRIPRTATSLRPGTE